MAISRSLMNRQLRADGGIMQVAPREKFGLGSKLKKFVRKIIPNEVADIAVKAAPFVAPFNPAVAAAMSGLGTFDQTGSIGDSLKGGALTYGLGQGARYLGGAGFQDPSLSAFTPSGFKSGFSSPFGSDTGIGKMLSESAANKGQVLNQELKGIKGIDTSVPLKKPTVIDGSIDMVTGGADGFGIIQDTGINKSTVAKEPGFLKNLLDGVSNQDYGKVAQTIGDGAKKFGKAMFTDKNGNIDKAAVMGAITFAASYAEARALAAETGVDEDLTEEEYNEALKDEKKEEYAGYLTNFFGGVKDGGRIGFNDGSDPGDIVLASDSNDDLIKSGKFARVVRVLMDEGFDFAEAVKEAMRQGYNQGGRIGFESGANEMIKTQLLEEIMPNTDTTTEDYIVIMTEDGPKVVLRSQAPSESMMMDTTTSVFGNAGQGRRIPEELRADGGRIGFSEGSDLMTLNVKKMWEAEGEDDPLGTIVKMGMTFRAPIIDLVKIIGVSASTAAGLVADAVKLGYDVTEPIRDVVGDVAGGIYDVGKEMVKGSKDNTRFIQPLYYLQRFGGNKNLTDDETRLLMQKQSVGRKDDELVRELENRVFGFDDAGISQRPEDKKVSETIKFKEKYNFADGGLMNLGGKEMDMRGGGFIPIGKKERADDVPARLSKNEFVMTADAVRAAGGGSVNKGAKRMYDLMNNLEARV